VVYVAWRSSPADRPRYSAPTPSCLMMPEATAICGGGTAAGAVDYVLTDLNLMCLHVHMTKASRAGPAGPE
jgi:hypothetical protein